MTVTHPYLFALPTPISQLFYHSSFLPATSNSLFCALCTRVQISGLRMNTYILYISNASNPLHITDPNESLYTATKSLSHCSHCQSASKPNFTPIPSHLRVSLPSDRYFMSISLPCLLTFSVPKWTAI